VVTENDITPELDTTLTKEGVPADAKAVGDAINGVEIYMVDPSEGAVVPFLSALREEGKNFTVEIVDTLPDSLKVSAQTEGYLYIVKDTGIAYLDAGSGTVTFGYVFSQTEDLDRGWSTNINAETESGYY
jgi:hypothetical protein